MALKPVLVLNADYNPLSILPLSMASWQDTMTLFCKGRLNILESYDTWLIRSPSVEMKVPCVVAMKEFKKVGRRVNFSRANIYLRDEFHCQICNLDLMLHPQVERNIDHVLPRAKGGKSTWDNCVLTCAPCNHKKGDDETIVPKRKPYKPDFYELLSKVRKYPITVAHGCWTDYLGWDSKLVRVVDHKFLHLKQVDPNDKSSDVIPDGEEFGIDDLLSANA